MIRKVGEKSADEAAGRNPAGFVDVFTRSAWLAWMVLALLVVSMPARSDAAFEKSPVVTSFSPNALAILRHDTPPSYLLDSRARFAWSRSSVRDSVVKTAGASILVPPPAQAGPAQRPAATVEYARCFCDPAPVRFFDAQGPPLRP